MPAVSKLSPAPMAVYVALIVLTFLLLWWVLEGPWLPSLLLASLTVELSFRAFAWWSRRGGSEEGMLPE